jgi:broad specificity phosphatase PhoE
MYTPVFYNSKNARFKMDDVDLIKHCTILSQQLKTKKIYMISHSRGFTIAHIFGTLFPELVIGWVNLDGGETMFSFDQSLTKYDQAKSMTDEILLQLFENEDFTGIDTFVYYSIYSQYLSHFGKTALNFPITLYNNIYNNDEINTTMADYCSQTLFNKIRYVKEMKDLHNVLDIWYVGLTHFFYFDKTDEIIERIKKECWTQRCEKTIFMVRHGETEWNKLGLAQGKRNDIDLNENGVNQSKLLGKYLKPYKFDLILCSPMLRTRSTVLNICEEIGYDKSKVVYMDELVEYDNGLAAVGKTIEEMKQDPFYDDWFDEYKEYAKLDKLEQLFDDDDYPTKHAEEKYKLEPLDVFKGRLQKIIDYVNTHNGTNILIVSHNATINWLNKMLINTKDTIRGNITKGKNCHVTVYKTNKLNYLEWQLIMAPSTHYLS